VRELKNRDFRLPTDGVYRPDPGASENSPFSRGHARFYRFRSRRVEDLRFETEKPIRSLPICPSPPTADTCWSRIFAGRPQSYAAPEAVRTHSGSAPNSRGRAALEAGKNGIFMRPSCDVSNRWLGGGRGTPLRAVVAEQRLG
jgi:hypothetical protein